jgi:hypothetical protein
VRAAVTVVALAVAATLVGTTGASATTPTKGHKLPKDACALLTDAQVGTYLPSARHASQPATATQTSCSWTGVGGVLSVSVFKVKSAAAAKAALKKSAKQAGVKPIKGVGDFAFESTTQYLTHVAVVSGTLQLSIDLSAGQPPAATDKSNALAIAKTVAKRL